MNNIQHKLKDLKLDRNRKRVALCPCGKSNKDGKFVPFVGFDDCGYCHSCGKTFLPREARSTNLPERSIPITPSYIPDEYFKDSLLKESNNYFVDFLYSTFGSKTTQKLMEKYFIDSYLKLPASTLFWQIDNQGNVRTGKIMLYDPDTGKRLKDSKGITWIHSLLHIPNFNLLQCFFGEHLLQEKSKPVGIVESEKTAIIAAAFIPEMIWIATGGKQGLKIDKTKVLKGRRVVVFPDLDAHEDWKHKAAKINQSLKEELLIVSDLLKKNSTQEQRVQGWDLADFLLQDFQQKLELKKSMICN